MPFCRYIHIIPWEGNWMIIVWSPSMYINRALNIAPSPDYYYYYYYHITHGWPCHMFMKGWYNISFTYATIISREWFHLLIGLEGIRMWRHLRFVPSYNISWGQHHHPPSKCTYLLNYINKTWKGLVWFIYHVLDGTIRHDRKIRILRSSGITSF